MLQRLINSLFFCNVSYSIYRSQFFYIYMVSSLMSRIIFFITESKLIQESLLVHLLRHLSFLLFPHELLILLLVGLEEGLNFPISVSGFLCFRCWCPEDCIKELVLWLAACLPWCLDLLLQ